MTMPQRFEASGLARGPSLPPRHFPLAIGKAGVVHPANKIGSWTLKITQPKLAKPIWVAVFSGVPSRR
jgi:hypothetical protein